MRSRLADTIVLAISALVLFCCGGGSYTEAEGAEGGPCYRNGTCDPNLVCASGRCVKFADAPDASGGEDSGETDAGSTDSGATDTGNDSADAACNPPANAPKIMCGGVECTGGQRCCAGVGCQNPADSCGSARIECMSHDECSGGDGRCCVVSTFDATSSCPLAVTNLSQTKCRGGPCTSSELTLCYGSGSTICEPGKKCVLAEFAEKPGGNVFVGVCQ